MCCAVVGGAIVAHQLLGSLNRTVWHSSGPDSVERYDSEPTLQSPLLQQCFPSSLGIDNNVIQLNR